MPLSSLFVTVLLTVHPYNVAFILRTIARAEDCSFIARLEYVFFSMGCVQGKEGKLY